jgi:hypothetical protein
MIELNGFYLVASRLGDRVTQALGEDPNTGEFYGSISPSGYEIKGDNESIGFHETIREATEEETQAWITWYTPEENNEE